MRNPELDGLVLNIEFTLISIIQGVALFFLIDNSHTPLLSFQWSFWPYVGTGLLAILIFWSRSILHTLTVIRWPLEFGHTFIYVACTILEAVAFTQIDNPRHWYAVLAIYAALVWFLFIFDLRIIRRGLEETRERAGAELFRIVEKDQFFNIRILVPSNFLFNASAWAAVSYWPDLFLDRGWHAALGALQLIASLFYMSYSLGFYSRISPLITKMREDELSRR
jgi:hypothetical protein